MQHLSQDKYLELTMLDYNLRFLAYLIQHLSQDKYLELTMLDLVSDS